MPNFFSKLKEKVASSSGNTGSLSYNQSSGDLPPEWAPATETSHTWGLYNEAPEQEYQAGIDFCLKYPVIPPVIVPSHALDTIKQEGSKAWGIQIPNPEDYQRFAGSIENPGPDTKKSPVVVVATQARCKDYTLLSNLPIIAGLYDVSRQSGVYYEVKILEMHPPSSYLAIGTSCRPYPTFRLPGWNRESAGLHLDDLRKFFEDSDGGRDYNVPFDRIRPGDVIGCGYVFASGTLFYTWNGMRLEDAFTGLYLPRHEYDVFAAIGVSGQTRFEVNFGGDVFKWKEGNEWQWKVDGVFGRLGGSSGGFDDELPSYSRF